MEFVEGASNFIWDEIVKDIEDGKVADKVHTRFPPEPNGYLHIGHAKAICINFMTKQRFNGLTNLRFDDTNPIKEDTEYVESIEEDIKWLGFQWDELHYASDYFDELYNLAIKLIKMGKAYVCNLNAEEMREYRGTLTSPGKNSPYRDRSVEENLELFEKMKNGEFEEGECVLRAKIDMASGNINMRDPVIYRIMKTSHHKAGDKWCIYPMYDFTHPLSDCMENITHSLCSLEFEAHRPLYDWFVNTLDMPCKSRQIEFARLNLTHTVMSKRKLLQLVKENYVDGWDDPRMPTISGLRRRGYTPKSIRDFCESIGVAKAFSIVDLGMLEHCLRDDLNQTATRVMAVMDPLKLVITNYPEDKEELIEVENNPNDEAAGTRKVPFAREVYIDREDFCEVAPNRKYKRLSLGEETRLKGAYIIKANDVVKDADGNILEVHCTYDTESNGASAKDGRKIKGTLQWVSVKHAKKAEIRLYDNLFLDPDPAGREDWLDLINPDSKIIVKDAVVEPFLAECKPEERFQFMRIGYFCIDKDSTSDNLIINKTVGLKDTWNKNN